MPRSDSAVVTSVTRRYVTICDHSGISKLCQIAKRELEPIVGDQVTYIIENNNTLISEIAPRKNQLRRCYFGKEKSLASNLDLLIILAAPPPLFNPNFIDRAYSAALCEKIPSVIVLNKSDLDNKLLNSDPHLLAYKNIGVPIFCISAKIGTNADQLTSLLADESLRMVAFTGVSGVGKSTLLNRLVPEAKNKTQSVSEKTGQGKQTTSQSTAYLYPGKQQRFLIDLPGIQNYGISHLSMEQVVHSFSEFNRFAADCQFTNCTHRNEENCGVKSALTIGALSQSRYNSYLQMRQEVEEANSFN